MRRPSSGFTLLEVVVSLAILSMALMWILLDQSVAVKRSVRARLLTQAIYLAKAKMQETEGLMRKEGFGSFEDESCEQFDESLYEGAGRFRHCVIIEKVVMPDITMMQENVMGALGLGDQDPNNPDASASPLSGLLGQFLPGGEADSELTEKFNSMAGQFLAPAMSMIQGVLEEAIRKVTVQVFYKAGGKEYKYEIVAYFTDVEELNRSLMVPSMGGSSGTSGSSSSGSSGSSSSGSSSKTGGSK